MKKVIITGSSRGIGRAIAFDLVRAGYDPTIHCRSNRAAAEAVAADVRALGGSGEILQFDVADRAAVAASLSGWVARNGAPYGIVLNAGFASDAIFPALTDKAWDDVLAADLGGFYNVLKPLVMPMILGRVKGRIVAIASQAAIAGTPGQVNYSAAKAGLVGAAKALAVELGPRGITVNCVAPGVIETAMTETTRTEEMRRRIALGRFGRPEEVASTVRFLLSDEASYITRQFIAVNGGL